jgi:hypothetical protein
VRTWQRELKVPVTGVVPLGQLVAVPKLPAPVSLADPVQLGALISPGAEAVRAPTGEREFVMVLTEAQEPLVPLGTYVTIPFGGHEWAAQTIAMDPAPDRSTVEARLAAPDGGSVCGAQCSVLPADPKISILSTVTPVQPVTGLGVPVAAIRTRADASTYVTLSDGTESDVAVVGVGQGIAIVEGLTQGQVVRLNTTTQGARSDSAGVSPSEAPSIPAAPTSGAG